MRRVGAWSMALAAFLARRRAWLVAAAALLLRRGGEAGGSEERLVASASPDRRTELTVIVALFAAALAAVGFLVVYAVDSLSSRTQLYGIALGLCFALLAGAMIALGKRLVPVEELEEEYPEPEHPDEQEQVARIVHESGDAFTRKRLLIAAGGAAGTAMGAAAIAPALSLGPWLSTDSLYDTPWRAGRRLVDERGRPMRAAEIELETFYTAFAEHASRDDIGSPLVVVRLDVAALRLPPERALWAPHGILAYSKICTHAACAIALYRTPLFAPVEPRPALVCPCHYSTFDPADGGSVLFGPAGRDLPQLPLRVDDAGQLRAGGNFSGPVGPSWQGVRGERPS